MNNIKRCKIEMVKLWINELTQDSYGMKLLQSYNGDELEKMSVKQIDMLIQFIKASYHLGYLRIDLK